MKSIYISLFFLILPFSNYAQVGIGTTTPRAELEIAATTNGGGLLIPKYSLQSLTDDTTVQNPQGGDLVVGTLVFNTNTASADLKPDFYYWDGNIWVSAINVTKAYGEKFLSNNTTVNPNNAISFDSSGPASMVVYGNTFVQNSVKGVFRISYTVNCTEDSYHEFYLGKGPSNTTAFTKIVGSSVYGQKFKNNSHTLSKSMMIDVSDLNQRFYVISALSNGSMPILSGSSLSIELVELK